MYATCIHCQGDLGRNELLETLPVGRRVVFDEATGRLWVVCKGCSRWNLVPFDSRYEAIESSARLFRESRLRMSTGQIGLAKTREGTELVRIGKPLQPEMAAWRYAGSLAKRRMRFALTTAPLTIGLAGVVKAMSAVTGIATMSGFGLPFIATMFGISFAVDYANRRRIATLSVDDTPVKLSRNLVSRIRIDPSDPDMLRMLLPTIVTRRIGSSLVGRALGETEGVALVGYFPAKDDTAADRLQRYVRAEGDLSHLLRVIMPIANEAGARPSVISEATDILSRYDPDPRQILFGRRRDWSKAKRLTLADVSEPRRLALEMLVHEQSERRWLAGELKALEAEWLRANEIASIADGLTRDPAIEARLKTLGAVAPSRNAPDHTTR